MPIPDEITLEYLKKYFAPADCRALDAVDPDRNERICSQNKQEEVNNVK